MNKWCALYDSTGIIGRVQHHLLAQYESRGVAQLKYAEQEPLKSFFDDGDIYPPLVRPKVHTLDIRILSTPLGLIGVTDSPKAKLRKFKHYVKLFRN